MNGQDRIDDGAIAIKDDKILFVGKRSTLTNTRAEDKLKAEKKIAMPGLINCHTHISMTLLRGLAEDQPLETWLKESIWPLEAKLRPDDVYRGAILGCLEMIRSGTTCFADMYYHEDMVAKAVKESGLRSVLAEGIIEAGSTSVGEKTLKKSIDFAQTHQGYAEGRITTFLGPHAAYSCSPELLAKIADKSSELNIGTHIHLAESTPMFTHDAMFKSEEVETLNKANFLRGHILAAHCINLSRNDMKVLSGKNVHVAHVPVANMKLGLGGARVKDLAELQINVSLGTDGPASNNTLNMFETMKIAALLQKLLYLDPEVLPAYEALKMATTNGARALNLTSQIGSLQVGKKADIILIDVSKPHLKPLHNLQAGLVYSAHGSDVDTVIVDGKVIMQNHKLKTLNEQAIMEKAEKTASDLIHR